jgi:hypothetical protein
MTVAIAADAKTFNATRTTQVLNNAGQAVAIVSTGDIGTRFR